MIQHVAIDTETTLFGPKQKVTTQHEGTDLVCMSYASASPIGESWSGVTQGDAAHAMLEYYLSQDCILIFHNAAFDIQVLAKAFPDLAPALRQAIADGRVRDTRVMAWFREPKRDATWGYLSLGTLVERYFGETMEKGAVRTSFEPGVPLTPEQEKYSRLDAENTLRVYEYLNQQPYGSLMPTPESFEQHQVYAAVPGGFNADEVFSSAAAWQAFECTARGFRVDKAKLAELAAAAQSESDRLRLDLVAAGFMTPERDRKQPTTTLWCTFEYQHELPRKWTYDPERGEMVRRVRNGDWVPGVPNWAGEYAAVRWKLNMTLLRTHYEAAAEALGIEPPLSAKTGAVSLEYDFWKQYRDVLPARLQCHLAYGKHEKLLSTYYRPLQEVAGNTAEHGPDGCLRVFSRYSVGMAETGRWRSSNPNMQNQPKALRCMYVAPSPDYQLVSADYKSLEMYTACEAMDRLGICNGPLRRVLDEGGDTHCNTARLMFGEEVDKEDPRRKVAKICNFALLGGLGPSKFLRIARSAGLDWTIEEAVHYRNLWFRTFSDCARFLELFRIDPFELRPERWIKSHWLEYHGFNAGERVSKYDLSRALNDGKLYEIRLPDGRVLRNRGFSQAANAFFQGLGADVVSLAFNYCCAGGLRVCAVVHDSITIEAPKASAAYEALGLVSCMQCAQETVLSCGVKIPVPEYEIGDWWS